MFKGIWEWITVEELAPSISIKLCRIIHFIILSAFEKKKCYITIFVWAWEFFFKIAQMHRFLWEKHVFAIRQKLHTIFSKDFVHTSLMTCIKVSQKKLGAHHIPLEAVPQKPPNLCKNCTSCWLWDQFRLIKCQARRQLHILSSKHLNYNIKPLYT